MPKRLPPTFVKILKNWGFDKNDEFSVSRNFSPKNVYLAKSTSLEDANSEKYDVTNQKFSQRQLFKNLESKTIEKFKKTPKMGN